MKGFFQFLNSLVSKCKHLIAFAKDKQTGSFKKWSILKHFSRHDITWSNQLFSILLYSPDSKPTLPLSVNPGILTVGNRQYGQIDLDSSPGATTPLAVVKEHYSGSYTLDRSTLTLF